MFTTSCFIRKNTPELQDKLKKLGYHICICCKFKDNIWLHNFINDEHNRYEIHGLGAWDVEDNQEEVLNLFLIGNAEHPNPSIVCVTHSPNQCIPYERNEFLRGTSEDCKDFYKTWE